jgi:hypothetical protein
MTAMMAHEHRYMGVSRCRGIEACVAVKSCIILLCHFGFWLGLAGYIFCNYTLRLFSFFSLMSFF